MGAIELRITLFSLMIGLISSLIIFTIIPEIPSEDRDNLIQEYRTELEQDAGFFQSGLIALIFNLQDTLYDSLGIDLIAYNEVVPVWITTILTIIYTIGIFSLIMYFVSRIWIG